MQTSGGARIGDRVAFRISDVFLPEPSAALAGLTQDLEAIGTVVEFSDSGSAARVYAVVQITPHQKVVLPVGALQVLSCKHKQAL